MHLEGSHSQGTVYSLTTSIYGTPTHSANINLIRVHDAIKHFSLATAFIFNDRTVAHKKLQ